MFGKFTFLELLTQLKKIQTKPLDEIIKHGINYKNCKSLGIFLVCLLKLPILYVQKDDTPTNWVEFHQKSIGAVISQRGTFSSSCGGGVGGRATEVLFPLGGKSHPSESLLF